MEKQTTYQKIADFLKDEILSGVYQPGSRLPSVRELSDQWGCTMGTVQKSFDILVRSGLVESKPGRGTYVGRKAGKVIPFFETLRRTRLVIKTEQFLLENISSGYLLEEITEALTLAAEHWRALEELPPRAESSAIHFCGSSDAAINLLAETAGQLIPGLNLSVVIVGSMEGIMALARGKADLAGCHLWDPETETYNLPYLRKFLPGREVNVVTLAHRRIGLMTAPGNPFALRSISDLVRPEIRYINRQNGSGTRVWFDQQLHRLDIHPDQINGYRQEKITHTDIARTIAEGKADAGIGLESAANAFGLDFIFLTRERYDLVALSENMPNSPVQPLFDWLKTGAAKEFIGQLDGYETAFTGEVQT